MKHSNKFISMFICCIAALGSIICSPERLCAQNRAITVYQYRHVPGDKTEEFIKRETTYWSKVAEKAAKDKTMTFWALLEKVGGYDLPNSSNYLFINTFPDIDKAPSVFSDVETVAGVKMADMETFSMSTVTSEFYLHDENWAQDAKAAPEKDFNYVVMNYHNTNYADSLIKLEKVYWQPFIQKAMDNDQTPQTAWGNAVVLAPLGDDIKFTTVSYDLYKTLQDALMPHWDPKTVFPVKGLGIINKTEVSRRGIAVYKVIKVVTAPD
ncbi:hypothetical protein Q4E93_09815 [Flavitalea sp. BT771]|uniref:hypothetical protein n=1 Tax=Flavitalea sp. BT771 TaxID=3063329 RepID=UPI0026E2D4D6|nr:hypothetical protein [Flavitalea sp. BT771]MDO6430886.1 hypothetical protein [Flavitalea sp. BT771]MDV6218974.1 hypothetical protein [Flavitalea sp. BT771]